MLVGFLEQNAQLRRSLSHSQMLEIEAIFLLYLLKTISFHEARRRTTNILDADQEHLKVILKQRLSDSIGDADCNTIIKPAALRLAIGDTTIFKAMKASPTRTLAIVNRHRKEILKQVANCVFPIKLIGPQHIQALETEQLKVIMPHVKSHVYRRARFLTHGDAGLTLEDLHGDLLALALRALRAYYPFRKGLHLTNSLRSTVTLRGRGLVTYATTGGRRRLIMEGDRTVNLESTVENLDDLAACSNDPCGFHDLKNGLYAVVNKGGTASQVAAFMLSEDKQDSFCIWAENSYGIKNGGDISDVVRKTGASYATLLSRFLNIHVSEVRHALKSLQHLSV